MRHCDRGPSVYNQYDDIYPPYAPETVTRISFSNLGSIALEGSL